jgi:hypothetical protein
LTPTATSVENLAADCKGQILRKEKKFTGALQMLRERTLDENGRSLSMDKFGKLFGINDRAAIARYESGAATPKIPTVFKFATLAYKSKPTQALVMDLLEPAIAATGCQPASVAMWFVMTVESPGTIPDPAALRRIARRAAELLGEE